MTVNLSGLPTGEELTRLVRHAVPRWLFTTASKLEALSPPLGIEMIPGGQSFDLTELVSPGAADVDQFRP